MCYKASDLLLEHYIRESMLKEAVLQGCMMLNVFVERLQNVSGNLSGASSGATNQDVPLYISNIIARLTKKFGIDAVTAQMHHHNLSTITTMRLLERARFLRTEGTFS